MHPSAVSTLTTSAEPASTPTISSASGIIVSRSYSDLLPVIDASSKIECTNVVLPSATKKYSCKICSRLFSRKEHRSRHELSHTKERPFKCDKCPSCFVRRDLLLRHNRTVHGRNQFLVVSMEVIPDCHSSSNKPALQKSMPSRVSSISMLLNDDTSESKDSDNDIAHDLIKINDSNHNHNNNNKKLDALAPITKPIAHNNYCLTNPPSPPFSPLQLHMTSKYDKTTLPRISITSKQIASNPIIVNDYSHNNPTNDHHHETLYDSKFYTFPASTVITQTSLKTNPIVPRRSNSFPSMTPVLPPLESPMVTTQLIKLPYSPGPYSRDGYAHLGNHNALHAEEYAAVGTSKASPLTNLATDYASHYSPYHYHHANFRPLSPGDGTPSQNYSQPNQFYSQNHPPKREYYYASSSHVALPWNDNQHYRCQRPFGSHHSLSVKHCDPHGDVNTCGCGHRNNGSNDAANVITSSR
ncbi:hypothetical protein NADFUDRAFT_64708 [Nadsonia fulvescens var. elongata DSM 6958]|uniref:C2H2-type domain-containing protein n=1 Tax=Nadsonia fulvescens var. elongata DSM 6958 TaxID=857566 RepID=A0A1E3PRM8_9ASCO|nr:hypothetical protein NADFUDRAFT_64708 [Nadsonia fulvescens var. elongata DSM 6958]